MRKYQMKDDEPTKEDSIEGVAKIEGEVVMDREGDTDWDWERWQKHFTEVDEQERVVSVLKKAIEEERYMDAAFAQDYVCACLVGWWAGVSDDRKDPYGRIIRISAEHGRLGDT